MTVEEYRSTIAVKAKNYIELFKVQDAFSLVTDGKVVRNAYCLPQAFYIYRMEDATTEKVQQLQQLLLSVDETLIPCVSYVYKLQGNSYVLSEAYFLWRRDAEKENSMGHYTEPIFYKEKAPIIPYYIVDAYGVIMEYADMMKPTIKDIWENIDIDTKMLIQILSLWHLWQQKPEVVQAYVKYSTFERKDEIAQYFNNLFLADIETDNEKINSFALWLEEQKDSTIRIAQSVIDTATMYSELQIQNTVEKQQQKKEAQEAQEEIPEISFNEIQEEIPEISFTETQQEPIQQENKVLSPSPAIVTTIKVKETITGTTKDNVKQWLKENYKAQQQWILPLVLPAVWYYVTYWQGVVTSQISLLAKWYGIPVRDMLYTNNAFIERMPVIVDTDIEVDEIKNLATHYFVVLLKDKPGLHLYKLPIVGKDIIQSVPEGIYSIIKADIDKSNIDIEEICNEALQQPPIKRDGYMVHKIVTQLYDVV